MHLNASAPERFVFTDSTMADVIAEAGGELVFADDNGHYKYSFGSMQDGRPVSGHCFIRYKDKWCVTGKKAAEEVAHYSLCHLKNQRAPEKAPVGKRKRGRPASRKRMNLGESSEDHRSDDSMPTLVSDTEDEVLTLSSFVIDPLILESITTTTTP